MDPSQIIDLISVFELESPAHYITQSVTEAIDKAISLASEDDLICITGSLYVVAEARNYVMKEEAKSSAQKYHRD